VRAGEDRVNDCLLRAEHVSQQDSQYHMIVGIGFHMLVDPDSCVAPVNQVKYLLARTFIYCSLCLRQARSVSHHPFTNSTHLGADTTALGHVKP
jgi:hypothetical protein